MAQSREPNDRDLFTRLAQVEYRLSKIENTQQQLEGTMTLGGYITEAFEQVHQEIDGVKQQLIQLNGKIDEQNGKIDIILQHITGMSGQGRGNGIKLKSAYSDPASAIA
jgi:ABC-type transporter Mla subunit MlaD